MVLRESSFNRNDLFKELDTDTILFPGVWNRTHSELRRLPLNKMDLFFKNLDGLGTFLFHTPCLSAVSEIPDISLTTLTGS